MVTRWGRIVTVLVVGLAVCASRPLSVHADGKVMPPRNYQGSLEELSQEAIIIFNGSEKPGEATEDLILKIGVQAGGSKEALKQFAWVVPLPSEPETAREDPALFKELFNYVEARVSARRALEAKGLKDTVAIPEAKPAGVDVLSRKIVGSYDISIVKETEPNKLNAWLEENGYQNLGPDSAPILQFYREKDYVFACIKVSDEALAGFGAGDNQSIDLHPLRFSFKTAPLRPGKPERTGGRDGIYFPMRLTSLQKETFSVNLYVFMNWWLNDTINQFGFTRKGFTLKYRDIDTVDCKPDVGKSWDHPENDPYLKTLADKVPTVAGYFQKRHPGQKYYLTNIQSKACKPKDIQAWKDDLWLFPYYRAVRRVPFDAQADGPASAAWPGEGEMLVGEGGGSERRKIGLFQKLVTFPWEMLIIGMAFGAFVLWVTFKIYDRMNPKNPGKA